MRGSGVGVKPAECASVLNVAAGLFPKYAARFRDNDVLRQWGKQLAPYSVDEACAGLEVLARSDGEYMPALNALLVEIKAIQRRRQPASIPLAVRNEPAVHPQLNPYRQKLRQDLFKYHRSRIGKVDADKVEAIEEEVSVVGEHERRALAFIEANPDEEYGRVTREFVNVWTGANVERKRAGVKASTAPASAAELGQAATA
jgi:hypothetical protein